MTSILIFCGSMIPQRLQMRNHDHKLQQWQQNLKQQVSNYDEYVKKLENENKELDSILSHLDLKVNETLGHFEGISNFERAANMEARKENLSSQKQTMEQDMSAIYNDVEKQYSDDCTDEIAIKDAANLACYRMIGLFLQDTDGNAFTIKSVSPHPPNVERYILTDDMGDFDSAQKIWNSLGH